MRVLLIANCENYHIGGFFSRALQEMGAEHEAVDESKLIVPFLRSIPFKLAYRALKRPVTYWIFNVRAREIARRFRPQAVLVTMGAWIAPQTLAEMKAQTEAIIVNYATDDPFNPRNLTSDLVAGIPLYDLYACTKQAIMEDVRQAGCRHVVYVPFGYDPTVHYPESPADEQERQRYCSDVLFVGGADDDRLPILRKVAAMPGVQVHLYGGYWHRDKMLRPHHHGFAYGRSYRLSLHGTRVALCLVRRANRDGHVMRSFETPACGAFMLSERTDEHLAFFTEDKEMACFSSDEELVDKIGYYLAHDAERQRIAQAGYHRVTTGKNTYFDRLQEILVQVEALR